MFKFTSNEVCVPLNSLIIFLFYYTIFYIDNSILSIYKIRSFEVDSIEARERMTNKPILSNLIKMNFECV